MTGYPTLKMLLWIPKQTSWSAGLAGESLWHTLFSAACQDHDRHNGRKFDHQHSEHGRKKVRLWQAVCSLVAFVPPEEAQDTIEALFEMISVRSTPRTPILPAIPLPIELPMIAQLSQPMSTSNVYKANLSIL